MTQAHNSPAYFAWFEFDPQFILCSSQFCGQMSVSHIPALNHVTRNRVNGRAVVVIVPAEIQTYDRLEGVRSQGHEDFEEEECIALHQSPKRFSFLTESCKSHCSRDRR